MLYQISHQTNYKYNQSVFLKPHLIRLFPRSSSFLKLQDFALTTQPQSQGSSKFVDLDGNNLYKIWFTEATEQLSIQTLFSLENTNTNPFNYLLEPWANTIPFDYPSSLLRQLESYLKPYGYNLDPTASKLAQETLVAAKGNTLESVFALNQLIYQNCQYKPREIGNPYPAGITWENKQGSCRDYTVLFMEVCRSLGIAARFVSGYQEGDPIQENWDLHAWAEVFLPGAGWQGYDPTLGLVVSDRHIPLVASAVPSYTTPVAGSVIPVKKGKDLTSTLETQIAISRLN